MDKRTFSKFADLLIVQRATARHPFSKSSPLLRFFIALRLCASGSYFDMLIVKVIPSSSLYHHIDHTLSNINGSLSQDEVPIQ